MATGKRGRPRIANPEEKRISTGVSLRSRLLHAIGVIARKERLSQSAVVESFVEHGVKQYKERHPEVDFEREYS